MNQNTKTFLREAALTGATLAFCAAVPFLSLRAAAALVDAPVQASNSGAPRQTVQTLADKPFPEDPQEPRLIEAALIEQGYFREDVPLSYNLQDALHTACTRYNIDYAVALGLIEVESGFNPDAVGADGHDIGLFQIRTGNHAWLSEETGTDPTTHEGNIECGIWLVRYLLDRYDSLDAALTVYRYGRETGSRDYAAKVLAAAERWQ